MSQELPMSEPGVDFRKHGRKAGVAYASGYVVENLQKVGEPRGDDRCLNQA